MKQVKIHSGAYEKLQNTQEIADAKLKKDHKGKGKSDDFSRKELDDLTVVVARKLGVIE